jgi:hypothetical protein
MATPVPSVPDSTIELLRLRPHDRARQPVPGKLIGFWRSRADATDPAAGGPHARRVETIQGYLDGEPDRQYLDASDLAPYNGSRREYRLAEFERAKAKAAAWASMPWPGEHLDPEMPVEERERMAVLLDAAPKIASYRGSSNDRLDPEANITNGSCERALNVWIWPSGLSLYVRKYGLVLPAEMLEAISRPS